MLSFISPHIKDNMNNFNKSDYRGSYLGFQRCYIRIARVEYLIKMVGEHGTHEHVDVATTSTHDKYPTLQIYLHKLHLTKLRKVYPIVSHFLYKVKRRLYRPTSITLFRSITMFCGTNKCSTKYFPHSNRFMSCEPQTHKQTIKADMFNIVSDKHVRHLGAKMLIVLR